MASYLVGHITVKDAGLWSRYVQGVQESLSPYDAKVLFRGEIVSVLAGIHEHERVVVIEFSDQDTLNEWFESEKYQSLISLRDEAADLVITTYESS